MNIVKKIKLFTEEDEEVETIQYSKRSVAINHLSPTVCDDYVLTVDCRVDTDGNVSPTTIEVGNTVYNNNSGSVKFNGNNLYYAVSTILVPEPGDDVFICQINTLGVITIISTTCPIP